MSEQPIEELTVQIVLLYDHWNFKYCTLFVGETELQTDERMGVQIDNLITRYPQQTFQVWGIKLIT